MRSDERERREEIMKRRDKENRRHNTWRRTKGREGREKKMEQYYLKYDMQDRLILFCFPSANNLFFQSYLSFSLSTFTSFFLLSFLCIFICPCFFFPSQLIFFFFLIFAAFLTNVELQLFPFSRLSRFSSYVRCTDRNISVMTHTGSIAVHGINFFFFFVN